MQVALQPRDPLNPRAQAVFRPLAPLGPTCAHTFASFRPEPPLLYEHVFRSLAASTLVQRARTALSLTRSFLLLEDDDPVDWEVGRVEPRIDGEPTWARAHRRQLRERRAAVPGLVRRAGQPAPRPQVCLCPIVNGTGASRRFAPTGATVCAPDQRGSRTTTGSSRCAIDL